MLVDHAPTRPVRRRGGGDGTAGRLSRPCAHVAPAPTKGVATSGRRTWHSSRRLLPHARASRQYCCCSQRPPPLVACAVAGWLVTATNITQRSNCHHTSISAGAERHVRDPGCCNGHITTHLSWQWPVRAFCSNTPGGPQEHVPSCRPLKVAFCQRREGTGGGGGATDRQNTRMCRR